MRQCFLKTLWLLRRGLDRLTARRPDGPPPALHDMWNTRRSLFTPADFTGRTVLDLSPSPAPAGWAALAWSARELVRVEPDPAGQRELERAFATAGSAGLVTVMCDDPALFTFWRSLPVLDVTVRVPAPPHESREDRRGLLARLGAVTRRVCYFEAPAGEDFRACRDDILAGTAFRSIELLGSSPPDAAGMGPVFRCSQAALTERQAAVRLRDLIRDRTFRRIAVVGKAATGKSHLRKRLERLIDFPHEYQLLDDGTTPATLRDTPRYVYFSYTALKSMPDAEAVFCMQSAEHLRRNELFRGGPGRFMLIKWLGFRVLPECHFANQSPSGTMTDLRAIFTVRR
ncbi:MAG: hypothetical protein ABIF71_12025 [Planctomycetota bacterium]